MKSELDMDKNTQHNSDKFTKQNKSIGQVVATKMSLKIAYLNISKKNHISISRPHNIIKM